MKNWKLTLGIASVVMLLSACNIQDMPQLINHHIQNVQEQDNSFSKKAIPSYIWVGQFLEDNFAFQDMYQSGGVTIDKNELRKETNESQKKAIELSKQLKGINQNELSKERKGEILAIEQLIKEAAQANTYFINAYTVNKKNGQIIVQNMSAQQKWKETLQSMEEVYSVYTKSIYKEILQQANPQITNRDFQDYIGFKKDISPNKIKKIESEIKKVAEKMVGNETGNLSKKEKKEMLLAAKEVQRNISQIQGKYKNHITVTYLKALTYYQSKQYLEDVRKMNKGQINQNYNQYIDSVNQLTASYTLSNLNGHEKEQQELLLLNQFLNQTMSE